MLDVTFPVQIGQVDKNSRERVHVALTEFKDFRLIDVRVYAAEKATAKGVTLQINRLPELIETLKKAAATAYEMGLIERGSE